MQGCTKLQSIWHGILHKARLQLHNTMIIGLSITHLQIDDLENRLTREATWMGFCHNDTQYGNLMLHMASDATLEAQADAEDLLDTRRSLDELPESELRSSSGGLDAALGSSPPSRLSFKQHMVFVSRIQVC